MRNLRALSVWERDEPMMKNHTAVGSFSYLYFYGPSEGRLLHDGWRQ